MNEWHLPDGFRFAGVVSGLRSEPNRRDVAVIASARPASAAGVFTQNRVVAAPVVLSRQRVPRDNMRGIVICSGNANACTGDQGFANAVRMAELTANGLNCEAEQILVASTGVIGRPLPMAVLEAGIPQAVQALASGSAAFADAAQAVLTTDTRIKVSTRTVGEFTLAGFAKGAAMIGPNMATMLGFILTDAAISPTDLTTVLQHTTADTFNCISVEGHTSTNDTVFALANGAGPPLSGAELEAFTSELHAVCADLARQIAADAEGANHLVTIHVTGCATATDARAIAKAVAESALVKTAIYGADPNWGRIVSAAGYAGVPFDPRELSCTVGDTLLYEAGEPVPFDPVAVSGYLCASREVTIKLKLRSGSAGCTFYTSDLTPEYIRLNADYTT